MAQYFKTSLDKYYINVPTEKVDSVSSNIICCVDVSGSMRGDPMENVNIVLKDIYRRTGIPYPLFCYNGQVNVRSTSDLERQDIVAGGCTDFSVVFDAMKACVLKNPVATTFIFMTDGCHTEGRDKLNKSLEAFKLAMSAMKKIPITIHVIGFGQVDANFLDGIRKLGSKEGLFRYGTQGSDLQENFNDMFDFATSRECVLKINEKTFTVNSNDEEVGFLVDPTPVDTVEFNYGKGFSEISLQPFESVKQIYLVKALNVLSPENEKEVREIIASLNNITPSGEDKEKVEIMIENLQTRMFEYINLFTQIKMGQVPEQVKLKLNALRHEATFSNVTRTKKLDMRVNKNVEYFQKTDIAGILDGFVKNMTPELWEEIRDLSSSDFWKCTLTGKSLFDIMKGAADDVLCMGILVHRSPNAIGNPSAAVKLLEVSSSLVSFDAFIKEMEKSIKINGNSNPFITVKGLDGENENINAVIPLYIHKEHFKRVRILEGLWLGHLYTMDSYGYHKSQEIALLRLFYDMLCLDYTVDYEYLDEFEKVLHFIITESVGFTSEYGAATYENFKKSAHGRWGTKDLVIPAVIGHLKDDVEAILPPIYYEYTRQNLKVDGKSFARRLMYGDEVRTMTVAAKPAPSEENAPDYLEKSFIGYFKHKSDPISIIPEIFNGANRKVIAEDEMVLHIIDEILQEPPHYITKMNPEFNIHTSESLDKIRRELLMITYFDKTPPSHVDVDNIISYIDEKTQGTMENLFSFDLSEENVELVTRIAANFKTVEGFAGLLWKYCPKRCGKIFDKIVSRLMEEDAEDDGFMVPSELAVEKLCALLSNEVGKDYEKRPFYEGTIGGLICWQPLVNIDDLEKIISADKLAEIEEKNIKLGKETIKCYRMNNRPNRHGYGNHNPNLNYTLPFKGYRKQPEFLGN